MKKTLTVNLNGIVFHIDEDAYQMLNKYIEDLGRHFARDEKEEILKDIEVRIAELFTEKLVQRTVVEVQDVQEVIEKLGQPNEFDDESGESAEQPREAQPESCTQRKKHRKLYRDTANRKLGGVAAGVAAYMDWNVTLVRILFLLLLLFSMGWVTFIYILMWVVIPEADSVAKRLEMQGVEPNVDNISSYLANTETPVRRGPSALVNILKVIGIVILSLVGLSLFASMLGVLIATIRYLFHLLMVTAGLNEIIMLTCIGLFLVCPAIAIVLFCIYLINNKKPCRAWVAWTIFAVWIASIVGLCVTSVNTYNHRDEPDSFFAALRNLDDYEFYDFDDILSANFLDQPRDSQAFRAIDVEEAVTVVFTQADSTSIKVVARENLIDKVKTDIRNGVLYIRNENVSMKFNQHVEVYVTAPDLVRLNISEASLFKTTDTVHFGKLDIELSEASRVAIKGRIDTLNVKAEEASMADLKGVKSDVAMIKAEEASMVSMGEAVELQIVSNEASRVTYTGHPLRLRKQSSDFSVTHWEY